MTALEWSAIIITAIFGCCPLVPYNLVNLSHEGAHWFFAKVFYGIDGRIKPYWHYDREEKKWKSPRYFADEPLPVAPGAIHRIAPIIFDTLWLLIIGGVWGSVGKVGKIQLGILACGFVFDFLWFWRGYFWGTPHCDGKRWRYGVSQRE